MFLALVATAIAFPSGLFAPKEAEAMLRPELGKVFTGLFSPPRSKRARANSQQSDRTLPLNHERIDLSQWLWAALKISSSQT